MLNITKPTLLLDEKDRTIDEIVLSQHRIWAEVIAIIVLKSSAGLIIVMYGGVI